MSGPVERMAQDWVLALTSTASLMIALDVLVVATALDQIGKEFSAQVEALQWTINAYTLTFAVLLMTATVAGDRYGRRRIFILGLLVFAVASAGCALAANIGLLIAARAVQGVGAAILMPMALAQVTAAYSPERRTWALGIYSSVTALSSLFGPVVGGAITYGLAWQWIFWLNVPVGTCGASRLLPASRGIWASCRRRSSRTWPRHRRRAVSGAGIDPRQQHRLGEREDNRFLGGGAHLRRCVCGLGAALQRADGSDEPVSDNAVCGGQYGDVPVEWSLDELDILHGPIPPGRARSRLA